VTRRRLPTRRRCVRVKARVAGHRIYVDVGEYPDGTPGEIFVTVAKAGSVLRGLLDAWSVSTSLGLQHGVPLRLVVAAELGREFDPFGAVEGDGPIRECTSVTDYVARVLVELYPELVR
jgi:ribonucleoside-diphosphate reductase alpha chain